MAVSPDLNYAGSQPFAPVAVAIGGFIMLALLPFLAGPGGAVVAALVPPWQQGGMVRAASFELPVLDIRLGGHLLLLDPSQEAGALARLRGQGLLLMDASRLFLCPPGPVP